MKRTLALALTLALSFTLHAQDKPEPHHSNPDAELQAEADLHTTDCSKMPNRPLFTDCEERHQTTRIVPLRNISSQNEANEILVAVRNVGSPTMKVYLLTTDNSLVLDTWPQEADRLEAFIHSLDLPHKTYRITFTIITSDNGKRTGVEHFSLIASDGQRASSKQGSKIPVATGSFNPSGADGGSQTQFTYLDVGMNFDITPTTVSTGVVLKAKVEQSSLGDPQTISGVTEPVIRQAVYDGVSIIPLGKSTALGSLDISGTTRHIDIEAMAEPI